MSILTCLVLVLLPYAASLTFNFTNFSPNDFRDISFLGDAAYISNDGIHVTYKRSSDRDSSLLIGRATYIKSLHLWDKGSNDLSSFSTSFTFVIDSPPNDVYADGLTFFLAQNNSVMYGGGAIGLPFDNHLNRSTHPFVAVEFDTFGTNRCDPVDPGTNNKIGEHVGININSMSSSVYRKWFIDIAQGKECRALIEYRSLSKILSVSFTSFFNNSPSWETGLNYTIDLRDVLPEWVIFGFSASTGSKFEKHVVRSWMFNSSKFIGDQNSSIPPTTSLNTTNKKKKTWLMVGLIVGPLVLVSILSVLAYFMWRRKKSNMVNLEELGSDLEMKNEFEIEAAIPRRYSYLELAASTSEFAETEKLGEGGFGCVYKGFLKDLSMNVAVKRVSNTSNQGIKEYASEVKIISRLRHRNLVQLTGWCHEKQELILVYEFLENGSLDLHLFKRKSLLAWNTRYKIARGLASALIYLHEEWEQCVLHRDIKSSNVMLDSNFNAKLGDFGLAKLVDHENGAETTMVAGTIGYMAPEYIMNGKASKESDVFSFGIVALEITCGRRPIELGAEERKTKLVEWVWDLYGNGTLLEAVDLCLGSNFIEKEMIGLMIVGLWCAHPDSKLRPSMKQAIQVLNFEAPLPMLPSKMPDVTCSALPHFSQYGTTMRSDSIERSTKLSASTSATTYKSTLLQLLHSM